MKVKRIVKDWRYPEASERELTRSLQEFTRDLIVYARGKLDGIRFDATNEEIKDAEQDLSDYAMFLLAGLITAIPALALQIYKFNSRQWLLVAISAGGKKNRAVEILDKIGANGAEPWYFEKRKQWISTAEASYLKLSRDIISDWSSNVRLASLKEKSRSYVDEVIEQRYKVYTGWTVNRSRGIVANWNSVLMRQRIKDAGVTHYLWRGKLDERERLKHLRWEGKRIGVNTDHVFPGEEWGCRCWPEPDFSDSPVPQYNIT